MIGCVVAALDLVDVVEEVPPVDCVVPVLDDCPQRLEGEDPLDVTRIAHSLFFLFQA